MQFVVLGNACLVGPLLCQASDTIPKPRPSLKFQLKRLKSFYKVKNTALKAQVKRQKTVCSWKGKMGALLWQKQNCFLSLSAQCDPHMRHHLTNPSLHAHLSLWLVENPLGFENPPPRAFLALGALKASHHFLSGRSERPCMECHR